MQYEADKSRTVHFRTDGTVSLEKVALSPHLVDVLRSKMGILRLFHMQERMLSHLLHASAKQLVGDVILCAPTGSGKTLAYALPIVQSLMGRKIPRLRAIVVVPTRDLAIQVARVFEQLTSELGLSVAVISGACSIAAETSLLTNAEILIATPGRLVDHIENSEGIYFRGVRYLVLDESDRLLQDSYQGWIDAVIPVVGSHEDSQTVDGQLRGPRLAAGILALAIQPEVSARSFTRSSETSQECVRKILVSATQTRNPKRFVRLGLRQTTFFEPMPGDANEISNLTSSYSVPSTMSENGWVVPHIQDKPAALLKILGWADNCLPGEARNTNTDVTLSFTGTKLIFTKSVESAHRLCRLLELCGHRLGKKGDILEMSGDLTPRRRQEVMNLVRLSSSRPMNKGTADNGVRFPIVVCSDVLARGMDILNVDVVINYDAPVHIRTYLHRAGRTARAGRPGTVCTLLLSKQVRHFREMVRQAERGIQKVRVKNLSILPDEHRLLSPSISQSLLLLRRVVSRERLALLSADDPLPGYALYDLWARIEDNAVTGVDEPKSDDDDFTGEQEATFGKPAAKKRRVAHRDDTAHSNAGIDMEVSALSAEDEVMGGEDDFRDLLFAQISRNLLLPRSDQ